MDFHSLDAISPVDGRYRKNCEELATYFSESALIKARVQVEIEYFIALCEIPLPQLKNFDSKNFAALRKIYTDFTRQDALKIKETEKTTNHDVKAVEYFVKEKFDAAGWKEWKEFIHFGLTSQDINNTAIPLLMKAANENVYLPALNDLLKKLEELSNSFIDIPMLAHTHGQPASPTLLGKEVYVFVYRLKQQMNYLSAIPYASKFGGATGNLNAHAIAYPKNDWIKFADDFVKHLGLQRSAFTTQIENYDHLAAFFDAMKRINTILLDLCRDVWMYISMNYFSQRIEKNEVGSSAMPHKVNPIDFENAEGNLGMAIAFAEHLAAKLPISRLQRDLTDSTVLRNAGMPYAYTIIAIRSLIKGLNKISINKNKIDSDLENNMAVVAEAIQNILRREGYPDPFEALKALTRTNEKISKESLAEFIQQLKVSDAIKKELMAVTPFNYTGIKQKFS